MFSWDQFLRGLVSVDFAGFLLQIRETLSLLNLSYSSILENKSTWDFLAKSFISVVLDLKQNISTFNLFALLVMMDYVDWFVAGYDSSAMSSSFSKIKVLRYWKISPHKIIKIPLSTEINACEIWPNLHPRKKIRTEISLREANRLKVHNPLTPGVH